MPLRPLEQNDFGAGSQLEVAPHLISERGFLRCENGLLDDDGSIYKRGGSAAFHTGLMGGSSGKWVWEGVMAVGRRTVFASDVSFYTTQTDVPGGAISPLGGTGFPSLASSGVYFQRMLFIGGGWIYGGSRKEVDYAVGSVTVTKGSAIVKGAGTLWVGKVDPGMLFRVGGAGGGGRVYPVKEVVSNTELVLFDTYEGNTEAGIAYSLKRLEEATAPYLKRKFYAVAGERLLAGEGERFDFSEPNLPHKYTATIFPQETVVSNFHPLTEGVSMLGMRTIGVDKVLVFHTGGIDTWSNLARSIVDGNGNSQHRKDVYSRDIALWGETGIAASRSTLVVPSVDNVYLIDGTSNPVPLGDAIIPLYRERLLEGYVPGGAWVARENYFLPIVDTGGVPREVLVCRLDKPYRFRDKVLYPWTTLTGDGAKVAAATPRRPLTAGEKPRILAAAASCQLVDVLGWFEPQEGNAHDHTGTAHAFSLTGRDLGVAEAIARWRKLQLFYELSPVSGQEASISGELGTGVRSEDTPAWDEVAWDEFAWAGEDEGEFELLEGYAPSNTGLAGARAQNEWVWMSAVRARYVRYRVSCADAVAKLVIRGVTTWYAPPGEARHSRVS